MTGERKQRSRLWREQPEKLAEMLQLRFGEGWSYRKLAEKYEMDHRGIQLRCIKHARENGLRMPATSYGPGRPRKTPEERANRKYASQGVFKDPEKLKEMLDLRFNRGWTLEACGVKYGCTREAIRLQCKKHEHEYPDRVGIAYSSHNFRPAGGQKLTTFSSILAERGETLEEYQAKQLIVSDARPVRMFTPRVKLMDNKELRDEFGEKINRGRSYKEYLQEQYPHLSMKKISARNSEKGL